MDQERARHERNPRGHGVRLRRDILGAATAILDRTGSEEAITLRAVAREIGIAAPSIYAHFADRDAIVDALVADGFTQLQGRLQDSHTGLPDPVDRLMAGSVAYLRFAQDQPQRYRLMFNRASRGDKGAENPSVTAFGVLVGVVADCAQSGRSTSSDPFADATAVWAGLHGYGLLRSQQPAFPWPDDDALVRHLVCSLARIRQ